MLIARHRRFLGFPHIRTQWELTERKQQLGEQVRCMRAVMDSTRLMLTVVGKAVDELARLTGADTITGHEANGAA